jgi:CRP-like cAMP-binding protein
VTIGIFKHARQTTTFDAGQVIFKEGDPGELMYAVLDGTVDIVRNGDVIEQVGEGGIFGELALVEGTTRGATATAETTVTVALVDKGEFMFLVQEHPTFALQVMSVMANRIANANQH